MSDSEVTTVLLVDDHEIIRGGFRRLFDTTNDICLADEAETGEEACKKYSECWPDVVVMDLNLPGIGGLEASRRILDRDTGARILIFSVHENPVYLRKALEQGNLGYLSKRSASTEMIEAVRCIARGETFIGRDLVGALADTVRSSKQGPLEKLSPREFEVFRLLASGKSVSEIADIEVLSRKTIANHYTRVKQKLDVNNMGEITRLAIQLGIISP
jgi:two-component system, NarL family, invasion response regulator UvrY